MLGLIISRIANVTLVKEAIMIISLFSILLFGIYFIDTATTKDNTKYFKGSVKK